MTCDAETDHSRAIRVAVLNALEPEGRERASHTARPSGTRRKRERSPAKEAEERSSSPESELSSEITASAAHKRRENNNKGETRVEKEENPKGF